MNISEAQMQMMGRAATLQFELKLTAHLRAAFGGRLAPLDDARLLSAVRACCEKAQGHGIEFENDIRRYAEFAVSYGLMMDGDENVPWIGAVLRMEGMTGTERMDMLDALEPRFFGRAA